MASLLKLPKLKINTCSFSILCFLTSIWIITLLTSVYIHVENGFKFSHWVIVCCLCCSDREPSLNLRRVTLSNSRAETLQLPWYCHFQKHQNEYFQALNRCKKNHALVIENLLKSKLFKMFGQGWVGAILASVFQQIFLNSDQQYDWFFFFLYNDKNLKCCMPFWKPFWLYLIWFMYI